MEAAERDAVDAALPTVEDKDSHPPRVSVVANKRLAGNVGASHVSATVCGVFVVLTSREIDGGIRRDDPAFGICYEYTTSTEK